jgi:predicted glycoside hydrolase/deacetylase ChbG (UPF0249 family)
MEKRFLIITADDFGMGPATTQGIMELARAGVVTATVLLVNSPFAEQAVYCWRQAGAMLEVGWHPCLTLDEPVLPAAAVPSLVDRDGRFFSLGQFLRRLTLGRLRTAEIEAELRAQWRRFVELIGRPPVIVNGHHHIHIFPRVGGVLRRVLAGQHPLPFLRRVREPRGSLLGIAGARGKRAFLSTLGCRAGHRQMKAGIPGNDWLVGLGSPAPLGEERLLRWISKVPGTVVELTCHPGYPDETLPGRDLVRHEELHFRLTEMQFLGGPAFREAWQRAGFALVAPREIAAYFRERAGHAA